MAVPGGVLAQQAVLRALADEHASIRVALHGLSHFLRHELNALQQVHGLRIEHLTDEPRQPRPDDLDAIPGRLAVVSLELPLRDAGHLLPTWDELVVFAEACAQRGTCPSTRAWVAWPVRLWPGPPAWPRTLVAGSAGWVGTCPP